MTITSKSFGGKKVIFESIIDEVIGGVSLKTARLDSLTVNTNVDKRELPAGTPVYIDRAARTADVCKSVIALLGTTAQAIKVPKNNHFKVGDFLNDGVKSSAITGITTTDASFDTLATAEALVYAEGTKYGEGSVSGTSAVLLFTPNGVTKDNCWIGDGNADVGVVTMGSVRESALTFPVNALYKVALRGGASGTGTSLITFTV